ncbi:hypothetical protein NBRC3280_1347 [Acetobacter pasteurianus NBRC 3280]|uniref:Uncharacterized protein n=1 Tax=Acetobacter pasteurianus NBRC 3278 TaxID=1226660 RepID=A0A401X3K4_ACEPA|nr:hypothetical protein [Acetobacter pasteurianus]GCD58846.1 hypothetical protein NBRC3277_1421 [Acetobacter pasteurianus NBRC 3277]GCD62339.1 hypothetical protein NBRC3278_1432 [Acetobacter pasteurianus NBRC 3278]GCD68712.1 hypothetical protein NBRC3280_1347 [Acetobacter pasteurianus NBRC 3280]
MKKFLILSTVCLFAQNTATVAKASSNPDKHKNHAPLAAKKSAKLPKAKDENVDVVSRKTAGGGMMVKQTSAKTISSLSHSYIEMQSPTSTIDADFSHLRQFRVIL